MDVRYNFSFKFLVCFGFCFEKKNQQSAKVEETQKVIYVYFFIIFICVVQYFTSNKKKTFEREKNSWKNTLAFVLFLFE